MKVAIVYASTTGNTEAVAQALQQAAEAAGSEVYFSDAASADSAEATSADLVLLGSPAMGSEELEDSMETFFTEIEGSLSGKTVGLFGSYDWGDGQFIKTWEERVQVAGATVKGTVPVHLAPEDSDLEEAKKLLA